MLRLLSVYLLPLYLALILLNLSIPRPAWDMLLHFTWMVALVVASLWAFARCSPSIAEKNAPASVLCPACNTPNPADRVLCAECLHDLYRLDDQGELVSLAPDNEQPRPRERGIESGYITASSQTAREHPSNGNGPGKIQETDDESRSLS